MDTITRKRIGQYLLYDAIAQGGMATVHIGRVRGTPSRTVAIKRLRPELASSPEFVTMFLDEARMAGRLRHPNVVSVIDVVAERIASSEGSERYEVMLVMEYVAGAPLNVLVRTLREKDERLPPNVLSAIARDALLGLHAAHETRDETGALVQLVHRDVSPQNIIVGTDGISRVIDFGIAKAKGRAQVTQEGQIKGKLTYLAPEQLHGQVTRATDVHAMGIVLWEALAGKRLFTAQNEAATVHQVLTRVPEPPSQAGAVTNAADAVVARALEKEPSARFPDAQQMAQALVAAIPPATPEEVSAWLHRVAATDLAQRKALVDAIEQLSTEPSSARSLPISEPADRGRRWALALFVGGLLLVGAASLLFWKLQQPPRVPTPPPESTSPAAPTEARTSVAKPPATTRSK